MRILELKGKKLAIWGLGKEGTASLHAISRRLPQLPITILNDTPIDNVPHISSKLDVLIGKAAIENLNKFDVVVKSPGISLYRKEIKQAKSQGVQFTSATSLWFAENPQAKTICVTGTNGKSTTTTLIAYLLKEAGWKVATAGNIGTPLLAMLEQNPDIWVIELSSYQLADFTGRATVALLLNLFPEHLDWHQNCQTYFADKLKLFQKAPKIAIANKTDPNSNKFCHSLNARFFNNPEGFHIKNNCIYLGAKKLIKSNDLLLRGRHNLSNICAALTAVDSLKIKYSITALSKFKGLAHRLYPLGEKEGKLYVDDSISTTPQSTIAAIDSYKDYKITLLLGGFDRGLNWQPLVEHIIASKHIYAVVTMPDNGITIGQMIQEKMIKNTMRIHHAKDLAQAVKISQKITPKGAILLSPAAPSYGKFRNFIERGKAFALEAGFTVEN